MSLLLEGRSMPNIALLEVQEPALPSSTSTVPYDGSFENCAGLNPLNESDDIPDDRPLKAACTWSLTSNDSASSGEDSCTEKHILVPTFQPSFAVLTRAHFQSKAPQDAADETLQQEMIEAINALPRHRFISVRSLTHLDALVSFAYKKYSSGHGVGDLLEKCLYLAERNKPLSRDTVTFLRESAVALCSEPAALSSLRARLSDFYENK